MAGHTVRSRSQARAPSSRFTSKRRRPIGPNPRTLGSPALGTGIWISSESYWRVGIGGGFAAAFGGSCAPDRGNDEQEDRQGKPLHVPGHLSGCGGSGKCFTIGSRYDGRARRPAATTPPQKKLIVDVSRTNNPAAEPPHHCSGRPRSTLEGDGGQLLRRRSHVSPPDLGVSSPCVLRSDTPPSLLPHARSPSDPVEGTFIRFSSESISSSPRGRHLLFPTRHHVCCLSQECYQWIQESVALCRRFDTQGLVFVNRPES